MVQIIILVFISLIIGMLIERYCTFKEASGTLMIQEDEDGIYTFMELEDDFNELRKQKIVILKLKDFTRR